MKNMTATVSLSNEIQKHISTGVLFPPSSKTRGALDERRTEVAYRTLSPWIVFVLPVGREHSTSQATEIIPADWETGFIPRTSLGNKLLALRTKAIAAGMKLLSEEEVLEELQRRRGELEDNETDVY